MKLKMFTVFDSKLEAYLQPFYMQSKGAAIRAWIDTINDSNSQFNKHPGDFTLFEIGEWDQLTCAITQYATKQNLGTALEMASKEPTSKMENYI